MSQATLRTDLPEPLSGLPEQAVVELPPGRPWLTLSETNRLVRQQGLAPLLARAWVLDELARAVPLDPQRQQQLVRQWLEQRGVNSEADLADWLQLQGLEPDDLQVIATQEARLQRFCRHRWSDEVALQFLRRKTELDQVVYSLLRTADPDLAQELHQRLLEGEASFADLAEAHGEGRERLSRGLIGPLPLAAAHPEIAGRLRISEPGQLWPPFEAADVWVLLRLEERLPAHLNAETRAQMLMELFEAWVQERVQLLLGGEPLPPLPPMPAADEELPPP